MNVLIIFAHPIRQSFPGAVLNALARGVRDGGGAVTVADLHREGFDPRFTPADHGHFWGTGPVPADVAAEQVRVNAADALVLVFPVYWWSMPALLKGWIDRVFTGGWAWSIDSAATSRGGLRDRPTLLVGVGGSRETTYAKYGYGEALRTQIEVGTLAYCGLTDVETRLLLDVDGDANADRRQAYLEEASALGGRLVAADRPACRSAFGRERPAA